MTDLAILLIGYLRLVSVFIKAEDIHWTSNHALPTTDTLFFIYFFYWHFIFFLYIIRAETRNQRRLYLPARYSISPGNLAWYFSS